jgi:PAS domain S-box-containing protein
MGKPSKEEPDRVEIRKKIMGLGERAGRKSYYPQLQARIQELEENRMHLEDKTKALWSMLDELDGARRRAEESEKRFRVLFEHIADGILVVDIETLRFVMGNESICRNLGYGRDELTSLSLADIHPAADLPWILGELQRCVRGEAEVQVEMPVKRRDGSIFWAEIRTKRLDLDERPCLLGVLRDITEGKRAKEALQQAHITLEQRVAERTSELARSNEQLSRQIEERKRAEEALRESERQLKHLSSELLKAQENERQRIANEIHDSIGQSLHAIKVGLAELMHQQGLLPKGARFLEDLLSKIDFAIEEVRNIYTGLRPSILDDLGILATMRWFLREFRKTYPDIVIEDKIYACEEDVPEPLKIIIFRVLQAARDNIARHSKAKSVYISLQGGDTGIQLVIQDDGIGFRLEDALFAGEGRGGLGLAIMQEQIESSGGIFTITSAKGVGTTIRAVWDLVNGA